MMTYVMAMAAVLVMVGGHAVIVINKQDGGGGIISSDDDVIITTDPLHHNTTHHHHITSLAANDTESSNNDTREQEKMEEQLNYRPIIGILAQEPGRYMSKALFRDGLTNISSYIAASYVKSVESAGARVVPILINQPKEYYETLMQSLNGVLFPGGSASITNTSGYGRAGDQLYQLVLKSNSAGASLPLWATCLGFEMLVYLAADRIRPLDRCQASDRADPLILADGWSKSALFRTAPRELMEAAQTMNITSNFHKYCVLPQTFYNLSVSDDFSILSTNYDDNGLEYVSTIEHKEYPIYGTQWHPEKAAYEWKWPSTIPHQRHAVDLEHHTTEVFVEAARRNTNQFPSEEEASRYLIYNYAPIYIAKLYKSSFQQCYIFSDQDTGRQSNSE